MAGVYVFDRDDVELDTTGLVGDLMPLECMFHEEKNGESALTMTLCYDELHKWAAVKVGSYIKAKVPVRVPPRIVDSVYMRDVTTYRVKDSVAKYATVYESTGIVDVDEGRPETKALFFETTYDTGGGSGKKEVKVKKKLSAGTEVLLLEQQGEKSKIYNAEWGTGWTLTSNIESTVTQEIADAFYGVENVTDAVRLQYQLFQVTSIEQTLDKVYVTAQHVFYELLTAATSYKSDTAVEASAAIQGVFGGMVTRDDRFTCLTDTRDTAGALDYERMNVVQAFLDPENGLCARYGLNLIRNNYDLYALRNVGSDRGFVVEYGKNMLAVERTEDISDVITRIVPFGKTSKGEIVFPEGVIWVDSPHIGDYVMPRVMFLDCSDTATEGKDMSLAQVREELLKRAKAEFEAGCDLPALSMTVDFISLGDTEEYKQYKDLDKVYLFDRITVKDRIRGYDYNAEVVAIDHNVLTGMLESVTLGSIQKGSGVRKIATWQVPEVDGSNIRLQSIAAGVLAGGAVSEENMQDGSVSSRVILAKSVTTEKLAAGAVTADTIAAGAVTAEKIQAGTIDATTGIISNLDTAVLNAVNAEIGNLNTDYANIKNLTSKTALIDNSVQGKTFVTNLVVDNANIVSLLAGKVMVEGEDGKYYALIPGENGVMTDKVNIPGGTLIDGTVSNKALIANSITTSELNTTEIFANSALVNRLIAANIDTDTFFAREAVIAAITAKSSSKVFVQWTAPASSGLAVNDTWIKSGANLLWYGMHGKTWEQARVMQWGDLMQNPNPAVYTWDGTAWQLVVDREVIANQETRITSAESQIRLMATRTEVESLSGRISQVQSDLTVEADAIALRVTETEKNVQGLTTDVNGVANNVSNLAGDISRVESSLTVKANAIALRVTDLENSTPDELKNSSLIVDRNGIDMQGGSVNIRAGSSLNIQSGGSFTLESDNFSVTADGNVSMTNATVSGNLSQDGYSVLTRKNVVISSTQPPAAPDTIWIKPVSNVTLTYLYGITETSRMDIFNAGRAMTVQGSAMAAPSGATTYTYTLTIPYKVSGETGATHYLTATLVNPANTSQVIVMEGVLINTKGFVGNIVLTATSPYWFGGNATVTLKLEILAYSTTDDYANHLLTPGSISLTATAKGNSSGGWSGAEVYVYQ